MSFLRLFLLFISIEKLENEFNKKKNQMKNNKETKRKLEKLSGNCERD